MSGTGRQRPRQPAHAAADVEHGLARADLHVRQAQHPVDDLLPALPERASVRIVVADLVVDEVERVLARPLVPVTLGVSLCHPRHRTGQPAVSSAPAATCALLRCRAVGGPENARRRWRWAIFAVLVLAAVVVGVLVSVSLVDGKSLMSYTADDSLISFRYSQNLADGHGPVWNLTGSRTDGYTSALWMFLIAIPTALGADPAVAAKVLSLIAGAGILALLAFAGGRRALLARVIAIGALVLSPAFLTLTVQGLETTVAALMATAVAWLLFRAVRSPGS